MVTLALVLFGCSLPALAQRGGPGGPPPTPVRVDEVKSEELAPMRFVTGDLRAPRRAQIAVREAGLVSEIPIEVGQRVERGDLLAELDDTRIQIQMNRNMADRLAAEAVLGEHNASLAKLRRDEERIRAAYDAGASNVKELEDITGDIDVAAARVASAEQSLEVIDAEKELLDQRLKDMTVTAPFGGVIMARLTEAGEWVGEGGPVADILQTDAMEAWMRVPQAHFKSLSRPGARITVEVEATGARIETDSLRVLPDVDVDARSFTVIVTLKNPDHVLAPGMSVTGWVPMAERSAYLTIHKDAVTKGDLGDFVFVVRAEEGGPARATPVRIQTLFPRGDRFAVRSSELQPGDRVIVEGNERLFPGAAVKIVTDEEIGPGRTPSNEENAETRRRGEPDDLALSSPRLRASALIEPSATPAMRDRAA